MIMPMYRTQNNENWLVISIFIDLKVESVYEKCRNWKIGKDEKENSSSIIRRGNAHWADSIKIP